MQLQAGGNSASLLQKEATRGKATLWVLPQACQVLKRGTMDYSQSSTHQLADVQDAKKGRQSDKRYQKKEPLISSVHTKVKGIAEVKVEILENGMKKMVSGVFDTADYTFPLQGNSFFVMTNFLKTEGQQQGGCKKGRMDPQSKGIQTGRCVVYKERLKTCEVSAWCPIEEVEEAPRRNILPGVNITCTFHKTQNPQCPIFRLGDIFQETGDNFSDVAIQGGIMGIEIYWDCNLDSWFHHCRPKYSFRRLDDKTTNESSYPGYNFRYAKYYKENNVEKRTLIKVFGIRFDILVFGTGGKFNIIQLAVYVGSVISYFSLATLFIDCLINTYSSKCCRSRIYPCCKWCGYCAVNEYYYRKKYKPIVEPKPTLKYVSFVDESHIRMVDQQLLGKSLQNVEGEKLPRPSMDLSRLPPSLRDPSPIPGQAEEIQLLSDEAAPRSSNSPDWCQCGHCLPSQLPESHRCLEELCCRKKAGACITTSEPFRKLVLSRQLLQFLLLYQEPLLELDENSNSRLRHCAYRCYATWRFGSQDLADFAILPSCCRWRIRREFPKSEGRYTGFQSPY
ncbi:hypothetical protein GH733_005197 [Mirounga leonina]|nr:hypothetical protein GH733_005197 [Mirounga leonina]